MSRPAASSASSTMNLDSYAVHSKNQYAAHALTRNLLSGSMERLAKRCKLEDIASISSGSPLRRRHIIDLGSADGTSTMETLRFAVRRLNDGAGAPTPLRVTFEEHPASDEAKLRASLDGHRGWFAAEDVTWDVRMQSFYEPLFEPESVDFMMSYICLHWLDTTDVSDGGDISDWKTLGAAGTTAGGGASRLDWVHVNEPGVPPSVRERWRTDLADAHLGKFLALRAGELRPGAEMVIVMVGCPHEYVSPSDGGQSPLTRAMKRCIERGELRPEILDRTTVPYFLRTPKDIETALAVASDLEMGDSTRRRPGALLEMVNCELIQTMTRGEDGDVLGGAFDLYWSIHSNAVEAAGPTAEESDRVRAEARRVFDEIYDGEVGIPTSFVACTFRRRTREPWAP